MASRVVLFAGAPSAESVKPESCTLESIDDTFADFLGLPQTSPRPQPQPCPSSSSSSSLPLPQSGESGAAWRSLSLKKQPLHTGFSQTHHPDEFNFPNQPGFFTTLDVSFHGQEEESFESEAAGDVLSQFCEHTLAVHNSIPSSQLDSFDESTVVDVSTTDASFAGKKLTSVAPVPAHLSDLEDVPTARQIQALNPQTVTLNLIVGVLSIAQPRTVTTRWGRTLSLVEVLVGDETKSGFAVTFWLSGDDASEAQIQNLRRQDVVLMQNVALHVFRDKVYGQSLRGGMTKVSLLWRSDGSGQYTGRELSKRGQIHPQLRKTSNVKDWVIKFVGRDPASRTRKTRKSWDRPPDDTQ
ncbi:hypothetical protein BGZ63DRAFT_350928 [Mariannaea sp. PMI_226]|nr:hypothetical protein BGZ63DRAFT_350928 [Mariannaea sp. PMI_226]